MLVHSVFFWLKPGTSQEKKDIFRKALAELGAIESADAVYVGSPALTPKRPVIDDSYDFALTVLLKSVVEHDFYQEDPIHKDFLTKYKDYWERVQIYDAE